MNRQATDIDRDTLTSACASILMYIECLMAIGMPFRDAKNVALKKFSFTADIIRHRHVIEDFIDNIQIDTIRPAILRINAEATYYATLHYTGKKDTLVRRCVFVWLGLLV